MCPPNSATNGRIGHEFSLESPMGKSHTQDRVWSQVTGLAPEIAIGRLLMALNFQAFIDESESHDEFVLAGHIAERRNGRLFQGIGKSCCQWASARRTENFISK